VKKDLFFRDIIFTFAKDLKNYFMKNKTYPVALKDMSDYLSEYNVNSICKNRDVWTVTPSRMYNKETRKLNADLGVSKVNYYGNTNGKKKV